MYCECICSSERSFEVSVVEKLVIFRTSAQWNVKVTHLYSSLVILLQQVWYLPSVKRVEV